MKKETAENIIDLLGECDKKLNETIDLISSLESKEQQKKFRKPIGEFFAKSYTEILMPIYKEHPELKPKNE